jgi:hypothetical protein
MKNFRTKATAVNAVQFDVSKPRTIVDVATLAGQMVTLDLTRVVRDGVAYLGIGSAWMADTDWYVSDEDGGKVYTSSEFQSNFEEVTA